MVLNDPPLSILVDRLLLNKSSIFDFDVGPKGLGSFIFQRFRFWFQFEQIFKQSFDSETGSSRFICPKQCVKCDFRGSGKVSVILILRFWNRFFSLQFQSLLNTTITRFCRLFPLLGLRCKAQSPNSNGCPVQSVVHDAKFYKNV